MDHLRKVICEIKKEHSGDCRMIAHLTVVAMVMFTDEIQQKGFVDK